jgi:hypothetical protein
VGVARQAALGRLQHLVQLVAAVVAAQGGQVCEWSDDVSGLSGISRVFSLNSPLTLTLNASEDGRDSICHKEQRWECSAMSRRN